MGKNGGDDKKLAILLAKECQEHCGPLHDYRKAWRAEGSPAKKAMDEATKNLIPFMVTWVADQPFHQPNGNQDAACQKLVATRLVDEAFYEYATNTDHQNVPQIQLIKMSKLKSLAEASPMHAYERFKRKLEPSKLKFPIFL